MAARRLRRKSASSARRTCEEGPACEEGGTCEEGDGPEGGGESPTINHHLLPPAEPADHRRVTNILLLHGGAGPHSMTGFGDLLTARLGADVLVPAHPGFAGTDRPAHLTSIPALAQHYADLLDRLDRTDVTVIGNSIGGWVAAELGLLAPGRLRRVVLVNAVGLDVPGHPIADVRGLTPEQLGALSFHDPARFPVRSGPDVSALAAYTGMSMTDPTLRDRLAQMDLPVSVIWGASDGIAGPAYGRAYADAIPGATFTLLEGAGHLPQLETPEALLRVMPVSRS
jgi:pimeloyl-ACP methyl ester carboxylesterase